MTFTPWTLFVDLGIISLLLLIGKFIRVKVIFIQRLFIPPSLIAGILGLALGPNGLGWLPLSNRIGTYAGILIAFVFGALPLASSGRKRKDSTNNIGAMWAYSQAGMLTQWVLGGLFGMFVLGAIWRLNPAFGIMFPAGFCGGHGTAAAIGESFDRLGYSDAGSLAMTSATVGIISSIIGGLILIKWATRKKYTRYISDFSELPPEFKTGLLPEEKQECMGNATSSSISIESLTLNFAVIALVAYGGYLISQGVARFWPQLELPVFSCAFLAGLAIKSFADRTGTSQYLSPQMVSRFSGMFTDLLVAFGVASIQLQVIVQYAVPLIALLCFGILLTVTYVLVVGRRLMRESWFEKSVFTWGWFTGTMAMGIALLRIVDPKGKSNTLNDYALAYLPIAPVEICLITFAPLLFTNGYGLWFLTACLAGACGILVFTRVKGWWRK